ncbi:metallophosphoesterase family protein [Sphingopyxis granuli]|uniref:metallophosphoesterase family protein n=1 Tax=Sphingopyxis granuli TaxID=267128 RepID=UPI00301DEEED
MGFFSRLRKAEERKPIKRVLPPGLLIYAIGDIHGRNDLFDQLLDRIDRDRDQHPHEESVLILLGDLVDRGPDSDKVVERALSLSQNFDRVHHLIGNHEECMISALSGDVRALRYFIRIGGDATVRAYLRDNELYDNASFEELAELFPSHVPPTHAAFLRSGEDMVRYGDYVFVHAGVRPGMPLDCQAKSDLRWIREEFLSATTEFGAMVVHGHTISEKVEMRPNRIGIDTGAYCSGALTALGLEGSNQWVIQAYC